MHKDCHELPNQRWYMLDGNLVNLQDGKCLDYNLETNNVYMQECHDGRNQKWYFEDDTAYIRTEEDHKCLSMELNGHTDNINVIMTDCADVDFRKFEFRLQ